MEKVKTRPDHPLDALLRTDRIPHIWCPGCGIGTAFSACMVAMQASGIDLNKTVMVSGIGCSGRGAGYTRLDSYHTTHGRAIPFATGMKLANPQLNVVVFSGDGDLFAIGGNHFIHAARRNMDITVVCVNNLIYGMTGGQAAATTPCMAKTTTTPRGNPDQPFILHTRDLTKSIEEALNRRGFSFIEVLAPCPTGYGRKNKEKSLDTLKIYQERTIIKNGAHPMDAVMDFGNSITLGKFIDQDRPTFSENYDKTCRPQFA